MNGSAAEYISLRLGRSSGTRAQASFRYSFIFAWFLYLDALMYICIQILMKRGAIISLA